MKSETYVNAKGELTKRQRCCIQGCNGFRKLVEYVRKDGSRRTYERSTCGKHRKNGTLQPYAVRGGGRVSGWRRFGISLTIEKYDEIYQKQNGCCFFCGRHQSELPIRLAVDHDHRTGRIRGLLCQMCNVSLGRIEETGIQKVLDYLDTP